METVLNKIKGYEKFLLVVLGLLALFVVCYKFVFETQLEKRKQLLMEIETVRYQYDLQEENKRSVEEIANTVDEYRERLAKIRFQYPPVMQYEEVMFVFKDFLSKTPFNVNGVNLLLYNQISAPSILSENLVKKITDEDVLKKAKELGFISDNDEYKFQNPKIADGASYETSFSLTLTGTMDVIRDFIKTVKEYNPRVVLTSFSLTGHEDGTVTAPVNFSFLGIMDKHVPDYSMLDKDYWQRTKISGKDNLFVRTENDGKQTTDMNEQKYQYSNADFTMRLLDYTEGVTPSTVLLSIENPAEKLDIAPRVYGNNEKDEKVSIDVTNEDGRYFAVIRTESETFPKEIVTKVEENKVNEEVANIDEISQEQQQPKITNAISRRLEITPKGQDLLLYVISSKRISNKDTAGVNLTINNSTDKKFVVNIKSEDPDNPRVKIANEKEVTVYRSYK